MCEEKKSCCEQPEKLKEEPEKCSPKQIKECHPDAEGHPCEEKKQQDIAYNADLIESRGVEVL